MALSVYVSYLHENSDSFKACTREKFYMQNKPDNFTVLFYCIIDWKKLFLHSLFDYGAGAGNLEQSTSLERFLRIFTEIRNSSDNVFGLKISGAPARVIWAAMAAQQKKHKTSISSRRNYYTTNALARAIKSMTDGELKMKGIVKSFF